jgi:UDP-glucose 4-epimerase
LVSKILITGVGGFIGSSLAKYFSTKNIELFGIDVLQPENISVKLKAYYQIDLVKTNLSNILLVCKPDIILHCAGKASVNESMQKPDEDFAVNVRITQNILESIRLTNNLIKFIYFSSAAVYGNPKELPISETTELKPVSPYGFHKLIGEKLCEEYAKIFQTPTVIVRIFSAYGIGLKRQVIWDTVKKALLNDEVELYGTGNESRDFIHIKDICAAIQLIVEKATFDASVYNLANGVEITISQLAHIIISALEITNELVFTQVNKAGNPNNWVADIRKIKELGYSQSVDLQTGIITAPSEAMKQWAVKFWRIAPRRISVVPNSYVPSAALLDVQHSNEYRQITFMGRLNVLKGIVAFTYAAKIVLKKYPHWTIQFVGNDEASPIASMSAQRWIQEQLAAHSHQISFLGWVEYSQLPHVYAHTEIAVVPSLFESFSYVCAEAMSAGCAVVGSRQSAMRELLGHNEFGLLVKPKSAKQLAKAIIWLIENPDLRAELGKKARQRVLTEYNAERIGAMQEKIYLSHLI